MSFPNSIVPLKKDTTHSCVFDWPDRPIRPTPPVGPPPLYPYDPLDDWDPTNPADNGQPGSVIDHPASLPVGAMIYIRSHSDHASLSDANINIGFQQDIGAGTFQYNPSAPAFSADFGAITDRTVPWKPRCFANFNNFKAHWGMGVDLTGSYQLTYDPLVIGDTNIFTDFWIYELVTGVAEDAPNFDWIITHGGFTKGGTHNKLVRGFPFSDSYGFSWFFQSLTQTFNFVYY